MAIEVREPRSEHEFARYYDLRWRVLREPWTGQRETAKDEHESNAFHVIAVEDGEHIVGIGRLHFNSSEEAQARYMAVEAGYTGRGIGSLVLDALEAHARKCGATRMVLNARESAIAFYAHHGYQRMQNVGTLFDSLVHWRMEKKL